MVGYAASKAHHTDVGGRVPGSISSDATEVFQEGLILPPVKIMAANVFQHDIAQIICANSRTPTARMGDLRAQVAGNLRGELRLQEVIGRYGSANVPRRHQSHPRRIGTAPAPAVGALPRRALRSRRFLDNSGQSDEPVRLKVAITLADGTLAVDYTGTNAQVQAPVNAVFGVTLSAVYYVLRSVTDHTIPMNEGCFRPVTVYAPEGSLLNPRFPAPVAGGNVETSMRNADVLLQAFAKAVPERVPACSGGTMTNLMVGGDDWAFYETIGVGMGGRPGLDGIDGIQTNMTNTLNTPIEAMERHFPIRMTRYEFRENSGGAGQWRGGCGLVRGFELLADRATVTLLGDRARFAPPGAQGGEPGKTSERALYRQNDRQTGAALPPKQPSPCARAMNCSSRRQAAAASARPTSAPQRSVLLIGKAGCSPEAKAASAVNSINSVNSEGTKRAKRGRLCRDQGDCQERQQHPNALHAGDTLAQHQGRQQHRRRRVERGQDGRDIETATMGRQHEKGIADGIQYPRRGPPAARRPCRAEASDAGTASRSATA